MENAHIDIYYSDTDSETDIDDIIDNDKDFDLDNDKTEPGGLELAMIICMSIIIIIGNLVLITFV